ncbi:hypothetical protein [Robbsia andropogonis]|uniref:hypothetical protein n=1 Tax=Robbsia andropogonis TaxID=28092 RepID=UPI002A6B1680|nr:hypothetical protein [Robbsia andropogonis]
MSETEVRHAIAGAFMFGWQGNNKPPSDAHWLSEWWERGRIAAELTDQCARRLAELDFLDKPTDAQRAERAELFALLQRARGE